MCKFLAVMFNQGVPVPLAFDPLDFVLDFPLPPRIQSDEPGSAIATNSAGETPAVETHTLFLGSTDRVPPQKSRRKGPRIVHPSPPDVCTPKSLLRTRAVARLSVIPPSLSANGGAYDFRAISAYLPVPVQWWVSEKAPGSRCIAALVFIVAGDLCSGEGFEEESMFHWASPESGCRLLFAHWRIVEVVDATLRRCGANRDLTWDAEGAFFDADGGLKVDDSVAVERIAFVRRNQPVSRPSVLRSTYGGIGVPSSMRDMSLRRTDADAVQATSDTRHFYEITDDATAVCRVEYANGKYPPQIDGHLQDCDTEDEATLDELGNDTGALRAKRLRAAALSFAPRDASSDDFDLSCDESADLASSYLCI